MASRVGGHASPHAATGLHLTRTCRRSRLIVWGAVLAVLPLLQANVQTGSDIRFVSSDVTLQRAVRDGVRHIVITDHLSAVGSQPVIEAENLSLSSGFIRMQDTSKSIVVCSHNHAVDVYPGIHLMLCAYVHISGLVPSLGFGDPRPRLRDHILSVCAKRVPFVCLCCLQPLKELGDGYSCQFTSALPQHSHPGPNGAHAAC